MKRIRKRGLPNIVLLLLVLFMNYYREIIASKN